MANKSANLHKYKFRAKVWLWPGETPWHFVTVPKDDSEQIKDIFGEAKRGWGSLPVEVRVGETKWRTSVFPDSKSGCYILPLKAAVRKAEGINAEDTIAVNIEIRV